MDSEQPNFFKQTMNYGLITGLVLIAATFILYAVGLNNDGVMSNAPLALLALCLYFCSKYYRDKKNGGYLSYGQGLGVGTMTGVFAAVLLSFFLYIQLKFIDPGLMEKQLEMAQAKMLEQGLNEDQVEQATEMSKKFMTPGITFIISIFTYGVFSFIISLITSAILKKEKDPFTSQMEGIE